MTPHGSIALTVPGGGVIAAAYLFPENDRGRMVLTFDMGEGSARVCAGTPDDTAAWLEQFAASIRTAANSASVHPINKAA
jgi:alkanesulfonate monooxygenase SsuD/methylene tetrahydromethanopterin reductase-like flavin-dependent oxidoreductase (luciferase family)